MTARGETPPGAPAPGWRRALATRAAHTLKLAIAFALMLSPLTAPLVLGWLVRLMRREAAIACLRSATGDTRRGAVSRLAGHAERELAALAPLPGWWQGIAVTIVAVLKAAAGLVLLLLPFGAMLLLAWWAGWENSFNKGYEQAWVGPLLALAGVATGVVTLAHMPMAFARFAAENRFDALFGLRRVRMLIAVVKWRYVLLSWLSVLACMPLFLAQVLPAFIEQINPDIVDADPEAVQRVATRWHAVATLYALCMLFLLRRSAARLYARAAGHLPSGTSSLVDEITRSFPEGGRAAPVAAPAHATLGACVAALLIAAAWIGFFAMLFIAQFANHAWWNWTNHPLIGLPWVFRVL
jgi:hypothetical protein